jgi:peptidoglycan/xylan/chitin deacetylase (PgdA/CDA1 family)
VQERAVVLSFDDGPRNFHAVVLPTLERFKARALAFVAPGLHFDEAPATIMDAPDRQMTWDELREVHASGLVDVESHTLESRYVPRWPEPMALDGVDPAIEAHFRTAAPLPLAEDLQAARELLERQLPGKRVRHLAFPAYDGTDHAVQVAAAAGYAACHWGIVPSRGLNRPGDPPRQVARISGEFLRRLPGRSRMSLLRMIGNRIDIIRHRSE